MAVLFCLYSSAQYQPTGAKTRFVNGIGFGTKSEATLGVQDSLVLFGAADSTLKYKFKGTARALAYSSDLSGYVDLTSDQTISGLKTFTTYLRTVTIGSSGLQAYNNQRGYFIGMIAGSTDSLFVINYDSAYSQSKKRILEAKKTGEVTFSSSITATKAQIDSVQAKGSGGLGLYSSSGTKVADFGGGGGSQWTNYGFAGYDANRSSSYTVRSFTDKRYVDSIAALKQAAGTYVTTVTASSPLSSSGGTAPSISIPAANGTFNGYLSSTDWTTFNNKQAAFTQGISGYIPKWTSASGLDTSSIRQVGSSIFTAGRLNVAGASDNASYALNVNGIVEAKGGNFRFATTKQYAVSAENTPDGVGTRIGASPNGYPAIEGYLTGSLDSYFLLINPRGGYVTLGATPGVGTERLFAGAADFSGVVTASSRLNVNGATDNSSYQLNVTGRGNYTGGVSIGTTTLDAGAGLRVAGTYNGLQAVFGYVDGRGFAISTGNNGTNEANSILDARGAGAGQLILRTEGTNRLSINYLGIVNIANTPTYATNALAIAGGLVAGDIYKSSVGALSIVY
jgi:hypothetical protein